MALVISPLPAQAPASRHRRARELLRLMRAHAALMAAASRVCPGAPMPVGGPEARRFLLLLQEAGASPYAQGRALALLEWQAERLLRQGGERSPTCRAKMPPGR
ncbi:hypothetical protein HRbin24_00056 [bacterium HR24]|jgi:hypothetical protein|nr:hypothetical protein HRbin24_00056 [bacterium HR24]